MHESRMFQRILHRIPKNTYPVLTEHARQFRVLHVQRVPRLHVVAVILQCTARTSLPYMHNTEAVAAQELVLTASPEGVVCR